MSNRKKQASHQTADQAEQPTVSVVTGGAGFLGSHLCDFLLARNHHVICLDNLITGNTANIAHLAGNEKFRFIKHDVTEYIYLPDTVDFIFHLASPASPIDYLELPIQTLKVGAMGTHKALGLARAKKAVFVLASTSEVYGDPLEHPQCESYWGNVNPVGPRGVYDEAKRYAEAITMAYRRFHGVDAKIVRIFNTYGPRMRANDGRVVPAFVCQALRAQPITIFGDGRQTRSFCYVSDLIRGIHAMSTTDQAGPVNLGNPAEMTIAEFAAKVVDITGSRSLITHKPLPIDDPKVRRPNIAKAMKVLNWKPDVSLDVGLSSTIDYFKTVVHQLDNGSQIAPETPAPTQNKTVSAAKHTERTHSRREKPS